MTFPLVIEGTGDELGHAIIAAPDPNAAGARVQLEGVPDTMRIDSSEVMALGRIVGRLRANIAADNSPLLAELRITLTDGGSIAHADPEAARLAIPIQLVHPTLLGLERPPRHLLLEEAITHLACTVIRDDFCRAMSSFSTKLARDSRQWRAYQHALIFLSAVQRFIFYDAERQVALRLAIEQVELGGEDRLSYGALLRGLQEADSREVPASLVAQTAAQVQLSSQVCPDFLDMRLLIAAARRLRGQKAANQSERTNTAKWLIESNESSRLFARRIWPNHQRAALRVGAVLKDLDLLGNAPRDILQLIAPTRAFAYLEPLLDHVRGREPISQLPRKMEEFLRELQETPQLGVSIIHTLSEATIGLAGEFGQDASSLADDASQLQELAESAERSTCPRTAWLASRMAQETASRRREQTRQHAQDSRKQHRARFQSREALTHFRKGLALASHDGDRLEVLVAEQLATGSELLPADAHTATGELLAHVQEHPDLVARLTSLLTELDAASAATDSEERSLARRILPLSEGGTVFQAESSTELFEVLCNLLTLEGSTDTLAEDVQAELIRQARQLLDTEEGVLQGALTEEVAGGAAHMSAEAATGVSRAMLALQRKAARGSPRARAELADAHFRLGLWAVLGGSKAKAIHHFCELIAHTLDDDLVARLDASLLSATETADEFAEANAYFKPRELELRRIRAAGQFLESLAIRAERELAEGKRPFVDEPDLRTILRTLDTGKTLGDRPPTYKLLRAVPVIVTHGARVYRVCNLVPAGWGGRSGKIALLRHLFAGQPFADWLGYRLVQTDLGEPGGPARAYVSKLGVNDHVAREFLRVCGRLFPDLPGWLERQRRAAPSQLLVQRVTGELLQFLERESPDDHALICAYDACMTRIEQDGTEFELLLTEYLPQLRHDFPKTRFRSGEDEEGPLAVLPRATLELESATARLHHDASERLRAGADAGPAEAASIREGEVARVCARLRAHAAAMAVLTMNVGLRMRTQNGRFVSLSFDRILPPVLDPEHPGEGEPDVPVSRHTDRRIDVSWVSSDDDWMPYLEVGVLYRMFLEESSAKVRKWATGAGFTDETAGAITQLLVANAENLMANIETLHESGGCLFLGPNTTDETGRVRYGRILPATTLTEETTPTGKRAKGNPSTTSLSTEHIQERLDSTGE